MAESSHTAPAVGLSAPVRAHDVLSVLSHSSIRLAKRWEADGTITPYGDAKYYTLSERRVRGIDELSALLLSLEHDRRTCLIRGRYIGVEEAQRRDPDYREGRVRRALAQFAEQPLHTVMIDIDRFEPLACNPLSMPELAIEEFICSSLPREFWGCSYHWQLSSSAGWKGKPAGDGAPSGGNETILKAHVWFWLDTPTTGTALRDWAIAGDGTRSWPVDVAVFRTVQPHYTAAPEFAEGLRDPVGKRSGFMVGLVRDHVPLVIDPVAVARQADDMRHRLAGSGAAGAGVGGTGSAEWARHEVVRGILERDRIARRLQEMGLLLGQATDGALNIVCPFAELHSSASTATTTQYFPAHTRGYAKGNFRCMHASCENRPRGVWLARLDLLPDDLAALGGAEAFNVVADDGPETPPAGDTIGDAADVDDLSGMASTGVAGTAGAARVGDDTDSASRPRAVVEAQHLCSDQANAERIIAAFGKRLLVAGGRWYAWDGRRWEPQSTDSEAYRNAFMLSSIVAAEAAMWRAKVGTDTAKNTRYEEIAKALEKWGSKCEMASTLSAAIKLACKALEVDVALLDRDPWLLNCRNGVVDLRTGRMKPHDPTDYITKLVDTDYVAGARSALWETTLTRIMLEEGIGAPGEGPLAGFLRRWFGYCCTGQTREQVFVVHWGDGSNGKSTVLETVGSILGEYAGTAASGLLAGGREGAERHPAELAAMRGKRMISVHESQEGAVMREGFVKQVTGGDTIQARFLYADFFEFVPTHKLQLLTNHKPIIKCQDEGIWRRVLLLPYAARFGAREDVIAGRAHFAKDLELSARLKEPAEQRGILAWLVRGAVEWAADGLLPPDAVRAASRGYQAEQDRIGTFIAECCELGKDYRVPLTSPLGGGLYTAYTDWCREGGTFPVSKRRFLDDLERVVPGMTLNGARVSDGETRRKIQLIQGVRLLSE